MKEGGLSETVQENVWVGKRRPCGKGESMGFHTVGVIILFQGRKPVKL